MVGARFIYKDLVRTIEDVGILVPGIGEVYYIANPGEGISLEAANDPSLPSFPKAKRDYKGLELHLPAAVLEQLGPSSATPTAGSTGTTPAWPAPTRTAARRRT